MEMSSLEYTIEPNLSILTESWDLNKTILTITFNSNFQTSTRYWMNITEGNDLSGNNLNPLPYSFYFDTVIIDTSPPTVISHSPSGTDVVVTSDIVVTFDERMNTTSIENAFSFTDGTSIWDLTDGFITWNLGNDTLTFNLSFDLNFNTNYTINIDSTVSDIAGNYLPAYSWSFSTVAELDTTIPSIVSVSPTEEIIEITDTISITFSEAMNQSKVEESLTISNGAQIQSFNWVGNTLIVTILDNLDYNSQYTITIGVGAQDEAGNSLSEPYTWTFTTKEKEKEDEPTSDNTIFFLILIMIVVVLVILILIMKKGKSKQDTELQETPEEEPEEKKEPQEDEVEEKLDEIPESHLEDE